MDVAGLQVEQRLAGDVLPLVPALCCHQVSHHHVLRLVLVIVLEGGGVQGGGTAVQDHRQVPDGRHTGHSAHQLVALAHLQLRHRLQHRLLQRTWVGGGQDAA